MTFYGLSDFPAIPGGSQGASVAPDFVRNDRGDNDDHWSRADGAHCATCAAELTTRDFVRRRHDGEWVHENCPPSAPRADDVDPETQREPDAASR